jgi:hypothetical protein
MNPGGVANTPQELQFREIGSFARLGEHFLGRLSDCVLVGGRSRRSSVLDD